MVLGNQAVEDGEFILIQLFLQLDLIILIQFDGITHQNHRTLLVWTQYRVHN